MQRHRIGALAIVAACGSSLAVLAPRAEDRALWLTLVALPLGYGHLIGGLLSHRRRDPARRLGIGLAWVASLSLLAVYSWAIPRAAWLLYPMAAVSAWHIFENDIALARRGSASARPGAVPRRAAPHLVALVLGTALALLMLSTPAGATWAIRHLGWLPARVPLTLTDIAAAVLMYHALSWLWFLAERTRELPPVDATRMRKRLLWIHAAPLAGNAVLHAALPSLHEIAASPSLYLYWSFLHALQTAWRRGLASRTGPRRARR